MCDVVAVICVHSGTPPLLGEILEGRSGPASAVLDVGKLEGGGLVHIVLAPLEVITEIERCCEKINEYTA